MAILISNCWILFCLTFGIMQLATLIMSSQGRKFYTNDGTRRKFSIMDLEFASKGQEIVNLIKGIYALPGDEPKKVIKALKGQLLVDFLFMAGAYGSIYLLCMETSFKFITPAGKTIFEVLAWAQAIPWVCDIAENSYLLSKLGPNPKVPSISAFRTYTINEWIKWGVSCTGAICSIFSMLYFWLVGNYSTTSLTYLAILLAELILFQLAGKWINKPASKPA